MKRAAVGRCLAIMVVAGTFSACGGGGSVDSDTPGLHAIRADGDLQRLDGSPAWERETWPERSNFPPNIRFMVTHPALPVGPADLNEKVRLHKVGWVRSEVGPEGDISPPDGARWVAPGTESYEIPLKYVPVSGRGGALRVEPTRPLEPGLYSLQFRHGQGRMTARIGVQWDSVDQKRYAAANCVDRYIHGDTLKRYRSCHDQQVAAAGRGLRVHLVSPEQRAVDGKPALVVEGVVVNVSDKVRSVPMLQAELRNRAGKTLHSWLFSMPETVKLSPGQSASFRTVSRNVPRETANVTVDFTGYGAGMDGLAVDRSTEVCGPDGCQGAEIVREVIRPER